MTITLRTTKGSKLTWQEADDNWREILDFRRLTIDLASAGGTANALTANFSRTVSLADGVMVKIKISQTNTSAAPTLNVNATGVKTISSLDGTPLGVGALVAGAVLLFSYDSGTDTWMAMTGGDALTFGGEGPSYYLNYDNFTGGMVDEQNLPTATQAQKGIVRLATSAEAAAGDDDVALTPDTLSDALDSIGGITETVLFTSAGGVTGGTVNLSSSSAGYDSIGLLLSGSGNPTGLEPVIVTREQLNQIDTLASGELTVSIGRGSTSNSAIGLKINENDVNIFFTDEGGALHSVIGINY